MLSNTSLRLCWFLFFLFSHCSSAWIDHKFIFKSTNHFFCQLKSIAKPLQRIFYLSYFTSLLNSKVTNFFLSLINLSLFIFSISCNIGIILYFSHSFLQFCELVIMVILNVFLLNLTSGNFHRYFQVPAFLPVCRSYFPIPFRAL